MRSHRQLDNASSPGHGNASGQLTDDLAQMRGPTVLLWELRLDQEEAEAKSSNLSKETERRTKGGFCCINKRRTQKPYPVVIWLIDLLRYASFSTSTFTDFPVAAKPSPLSSRCLLDVKPQKHLVQSHFFGPAVPLFDEAMG